MCVCVFVCVCVCARARVCVCACLLEKMYSFVSSFLLFHTFSMVSKILIIVTKFALHQCCRFSFIQTYAKLPLHLRSSKLDIIYHLFIFYNN